MPTELGQPYPWNYAGLPTHMSTEDWRLWEAYRGRLSIGSPTLYFDVRLGADHQVDQGTNPKEDYMWWAVNAKRADVLIEYTDRLIILELRKNAQPNAIGRLQTYRMLWLRDPKINKPLALELATDHLDPDVRDLAEQVGITYTVLAI